MNRPLVTRAEDQCIHCAQTPPGICLRSSLVNAIGPCSDRLAHFREGVALACARLRSFEAGQLSPATMARLIELELVGDGT
jgi:hypothetical protein